MTRQQAVKIATECLQKHGTKAETAYIYLWEKPSKAAGVRVSECGFTWKKGTAMGGSAYMQSDPDGIAVCAAVERVILDLLAEGDSRGETDSEVDRSVWLLDWLLSDESGKE